VLPAGHPEMAMPLNNLGVVLFEQKRLAEAEPLLREALAIDRKALPAAHPDLVEGSLKLGNLLKDLPGREKAGEAEALLREALVARRALAPEPADLALILGNVARLCRKQGKFDQSVPLYAELLQREEAAHGRRHPDTLMAVANLGVNYKDAGRLAEATPLLEEAYHASKQVPSVAFVGTQLLDAYAKVLDPQKPETIARVTTLVEELLVIARAELAKDSPELANRVALIGERLLGSRAIVHAEPLFVEIAAVMRRVYPGDHAEVALALHNLGYLRGLLGRAAEAKDVLVEALAMRRRLHAGDHFEIATTLAILGGAQHALGENGAARTSYDEALAMRRRLKPGGSAVQAHVLWQLATLGLAEGKAAEALPKLEECVAMAERMEPVASRLAAYRETLAKCKAAMSGGK